MPRKSEAAAGSAKISGPAQQAQAMGWALVLLRVFVGAKFLQAGIGKLDWIGTESLARQLTQWTTGPNPAALSSYVSVLRQFVLPHAAVFTYLVVFGELLVGIFLILGLLTRAATLPALLMNMSYLLATWNLGAATQGFNEAMLAMELALLLSGAGRLCGLDMTLARKHPQWPLW